ncbi:hypothetical protein CBR_g23439 [Chara braunii]|uniref:tRNA(Ile)-lysidine synthetase n=1 Tax=Chara braunii TaxID=69332 RepID=A0A388L480_CHABU|nr:hypothetical protein CBR_g23439 [Chara braunii]|eukprot:GBG77114.1 hypothetical protein CBR_g23439 [Chara braunii]
MVRFFGNVIGKEVKLVDESHRTGDGVVDLVLGLVEDQRIVIRNPSDLTSTEKKMLPSLERVDEGLKPDNAKAANIRDWPRPQSVTEMRSFLGMTGYYRNFVKNYSIVAAPLTDMTRLDTPWEWTERCKAAFKHLKHALTHHEVLKLPDPNKSFIVTMDANQYGIGVVLAQQAGPKLRPIEYMSKKMPSRTLAKSTYEKELYAIYKALTHWRHYLLGRFFIVRTDHQTLKWMRTQPLLSDALKRWIEVIEQYDFEPQYLKGEYNNVADALSHRPDFSSALITEFGLADDVTHSTVGAYCEDPFMSEIICRLEAKDNVTFAEFELVNGLLFLEKAGNKRLLGESLSMDFMDTLVTSKSGMRSARRGAPAMALGEPRCRSRVQLQGTVQILYTGKLRSRDRPLGSASATAKAVAVSGGADSMALSLLVSRWMENWRGKGDKDGSRSSHTKIFGMVVDHDLRSGSCEEAAKVGDWVLAIGMEHVGLRCHWPLGKPAGGHLQEAARLSRYGLLLHECRKRRIRVLMTGHHADDQAELFLLRLAHSSGIRGLAGMPIASFASDLISGVGERMASFASDLTSAVGERIVPGVVNPENLGLGCEQNRVMLVRPLLKLSKAQLKEVCVTLSQEWVEDPSNHVSLFSRNRIRQVLQDPESGIDWGLPVATPTKVMKMAATIARLDKRGSPANLIGPVR